MVRPRRAVAVLLALLCVASMLTACEGRFAGLHLRVASGGVRGVYYALAQPLADAWSAQLGIDRPQVLQTAGSPDNLRRLRAGQADVAFSAADVAENGSTGGPQLRALARIYDDYLHLVVRADSPIRQLADLRGRRVSVGSPESGVEVIAGRLLTAAHLTGTLTVSHDSLEDSADALAEHRIDAFFWSGGLPTGGVTQLAGRTPIRLLDLTSVLPAMRHDFPIYGTASIPASTYQLTGGPVTTLVVPNFLVVDATMPDDEAEALVRGVFQAQDRLVTVSNAALSIDIHSAIDTAPVPLHPGALRYYRDSKI